MHLRKPLKTKTFSAHGEGGNSGGIDGRGKLAYNELFLMHIVTTCSIHKNSQGNYCLLYTSDAADDHNSV